MTEESLKALTSQQEDNECCSLEVSQAPARATTLEEG